MLFVWKQSVRGTCTFFHVVNTALLSSQRCPECRLQLSAEVEQFQQSFNPSSNTIDLTAQQHTTENPSRANIDNATMGLDYFERPTAQRRTAINPSRVNPSHVNIDNASQGVLFRILLDNLMS